MRISEREMNTSMDERREGVEAGERPPRENERVLHLEELIGLDPDAERALRERSVQVELVAVVRCEHGALAETLVETAARLRQPPEPAEAVGEDPARIAPLRRPDQ